MMKINKNPQSLTVPLDRITIKVYETNGRWFNYDACSHGIWDYVYNVYFDGFLAHSVTVRGIEPSVAREMFAGIEIIEETR